MEVPSWFKEDWIDTDAKALGLYKALLYYIFEYYFESDKNRIINSVKAEIATKLTGNDAFEASNSAETFLENLFTDKSINIQVLSVIEGKYYNKFRKACHKYFKRRYIERLEDKDKKDLITILERLKLRPDKFTKTGSVSVSYTHLTLPTNREV